jgi:hypothetical protein
MGDLTQGAPAAAPAFRVQGGDFTLDRVCGLLCCAFEGGSNYWYRDAKIDRLPDGYVRADFKVGGRHEQALGSYWHWIQAVPVLGGEVSFIHEEDEPRAVLGREQLARGLELLKATRHWADFVDENDDADTGDAFLQLCVFGEVVYG